MSAAAKACYVYGISVDGVIRYIGLSLDPYQRLKQHISDAMKRPSGLVGPKLASAIRTKAEITVVIIHSCKTRDEAANLEVVEIASRGGHTRRGRQLWNTHIGGMGGSSEASADVLRAKWRDPEFRERMSTAAKLQIARQRADDPGFEARRLEAVRAKAKTPEAAANLAAARRNVDRDKHRAAVSAMVKSRWKDPVYRERQLLALADGRAKWLAARKIDVK